MLEPDDGKLSCPVLRGEWGSNAPDLLDKLQPYVKNHEKEFFYYNTFWIIVSSPSIICISMLHSIYSWL